MQVGWRGGATYAPSGVRSGALMTSSCEASCVMTAGPRDVVRIPQSCMFTGCGHHTIIVVVRSSSSAGTVPHLQSNKTAALDGANSWNLYAQRCPPTNGAECVLPHGGGRTPP